ncbi:MAG: hypothetical protein WKF58_18895 [Ilumatobacteraceae bacterium]
MPLHGTWDEVLRRRRRLSRAIGRWIPERRWFAGKGSDDPRSLARRRRRAERHGGDGDGARVVHRR